jgi:hypothetical protein
MGRAGTWKRGLRPGSQPSRSTPRRTGEGPLQERQGHGGDKRPGACRHIVRGHSCWSSIMSGRRGPARADSARRCIYPPYTLVGAADVAPVSVTPNTAILAPDQVRMRILGIHSDLPKLARCRYAQCQWRRSRMTLNRLPCRPAEMSAPGDQRR